MKGMWLEDGVASLREDLDRPRLEDNVDCLVRVSLAGICSTDVAMLDGLYPFTGIMGHEFTGVVEKVCRKWNLRTSAKNGEVWFEPEEGGIGDLAHLIEDPIPVGLASGGAQATLLEDALTE